MEEERQNGSRNREREQEAEQEPEKRGQEKGAGRRSGEKGVGRGAVKRRLTLACMAIRLEGEARDGSKLLRQGARAQLSQGRLAGGAASARAFKRVLRHSGSFPRSRWAHFFRQRTRQSLSPTSAHTRWTGCCTGTMP